MIRPIPLRRYLAVMQSRGHAAARLLDGSGLADAALDDPQCLIDTGAYRRVVENIIALAGEEGIGMEMGLARELADFRILGYAALASRSVRYSMEEIWGRYGDSLGMMARLAPVQEDAPTVTFDIIAANMSAATHRFFVEEALCVLVKIGHQVSGTPPHFERLELAYAAPAYAARYSELFDCPIRFGAGGNRVTLSRAWLELPLATSDEELLNLYRQNLEQLKWQIEASGSAGMRLHSLLVKLNGRIPPLDDAACVLGLSPRTLRRQLQLEGLSYRSVSEAFRLETVLACMKTGRLSAKQLGEQAGFDDVNAFRRAFKKWTGKTVREYRLAPE